MHPTGMFSCLITGRNEVLAKVIFSQASVIHSVHRGVWSRGGPPNLGGVLVPGRGSPNFWGFSKFSGGWGSPNFWGAPNFGGGSSKFSAGLQILRGVPLNFRGWGWGVGSSKFSGGVSTRIRLMFSWYASYWNAFLLSFSFSLEMPIIFFPRTAKQYISNMFYSFYGII